MPKATNRSYSNSKPLVQVVLLYITSCGLYFFYWFYKMSQQIYSAHSKATPPLWRTLGLLVPLLNIYLVWKLFVDIKKRCELARVKSFRYPSLLALIFLLCAVLYRLPDLYSFLGFSSVLPILLVQNTMNHYWKKEQPHLPVRKKFSWPEILICIAGSILLVGATIGAGLPPEAIKSSAAVDTPAASKLTPDETAGQKAGEHDASEP